MKESELIKIKKQHEGLLAATNKLITQAQYNQGRLDGLAALLKEMPGYKEALESLSEKMNPKDGDEDKEEIKWDESQ